MTTCGACTHPIDGSPEACFWCGGDLCVACWEDIGHCGHEEAEACNVDSARPERSAAEYVALRAPPNCQTCGEPGARNEQHDAYACAKCDEWLELMCLDRQCEFCANRPEKPSQVAP